MLQSRAAEPAHRVCGGQVVDEIARVEEAERTEGAAGRDGPTTQELLDEVAVEFTEAFEDISLAWGRLLEQARRPARRPRLCSPRDWAAGVANR